MKSTLLTISTVLLVSLTSIAQNLIAVQNGGTPTFYSILSEAISSAQNKDTIYIPGGSYTFNNNLITINKELHLIGVGHNPDSTNVGGITLLNATIKLFGGANNSSFEGFKLSNDFYTGNNIDHDVDYITISRCNVQDLYLSRLSTNWTVYENVIRGNIRGYAQTYTTLHAQNNSFLNNVIGYIYYFGPNNEFKNNYFNYPDSSISIDGCLFQNNIFVSNNTTASMTSCIFNNNLYFTGFTIPSGSTGSNNIVSQTAADTFVNATGTIFSYSDDYHLKATSPGKNAGKDGTDIGIYGGVFPWKEGSIPFNPHFQSATIAPTTDNTGKLNVQIKVSAQDN